MDTAAYLISQGWRGDGHSLHYTGRGITKPISISQKANTFGIGKKKHDAHADQWWARAFDDTLKGLNATKDEATGRTERISMGAGAQALQLVEKVGAKWVAQGGLYSNFVRGESLSGTLTPDERFMANKDDQNESKGVNGVANFVSGVPPDEKHKKHKRDKQEEIVEPLDLKSKHDHSRYSAMDTKARDKRQQRKEEKRRAKKALRSSRSDQEVLAKNVIDVESVLLEKSKGSKSRKEKRRHREAALTIGEADGVPDKETESITQKDGRATISGCG